MEGLDNYLTTEPNNGYQDWLEAVWQNMPLSLIDDDAYQQHESFFDVWAHHLSKDGFPSTDDTAKLIYRKYKEYINSFPVGHFALEIEAASSEGDIAESSGRKTTP